MAHPQMRKGTPNKRSTNSGCVAHGRATMFCMNCGNELPDTAKFCKTCGAPQQEASAPVIAKSPPNPEPLPTSPASAPELVASKRCPVCHRTDMMQKVSSITSQGTTTGSVAGTQP